MTRTVRNGLFCSANVQFIHHCPALYSFWFSNTIDIMLNPLTMSTFYGPLMKKWVKNVWTVFFLCVCFIYFFLLCFISTNCYTAILNIAHISLIRTLHVRLQIRDGLCTGNLTLNLILIAGITKMKRQHYVPDSWRARILGGLSSHTWC